MLTQVLPGPSVDYALFYCIEYFGFIVKNQVFVGVWSFILFHFILLHYHTWWFLCQYHSVSINITLKWSLKSGTSFIVQHCFSNLGFCLSIWSWILFVHVYKDFIEIRVHIELNLNIAIGKMAIITMLTILIHEHGISYHIRITSPIII